jgi:hypothetical protein
MAKAEALALSVLLNLIVLDRYGGLSVLVYD